MATRSRRRGTPTAAELRPAPATPDSQQTDPLVFRDEHGELQATPEFARIIDDIVRRYEVGLRWLADH